MADRYQLNRFVEAQARVYPNVVDELRTGRKRTHWIWFIFPPLTGLGSSDLAERYAIASLGEARAYLAHDLLGHRLHECARLLTAVQGRSIGEIVGSPDDLKVRSSMTLFARAAGGGADAADFVALLDKYYDGVEDPRTVSRLTG